MENARQFDVNVYRHSVGDNIKLTILRDAQQLDVQVEVGERDDDPQRFADLVDPEKNQVRKLGILGIEITAKIAALLPDLRKPYGVVVAARIAAVPSGAELQPGDVVHEVNGEPIATIAALREVLDKQEPDTPLVLQVERDGKLMYQMLELE
jgi:S1-C subfamily serine protease